MSATMTERLTLHVVDPDLRSRGDVVRGAFRQGHVAHGYDALDSLIGRAPDEGLILLGLLLFEEERAALLDRLDAAGVWLPVIAMGRDPAVPLVVDAMRAGVLAVLCLPLDFVRFSTLLAQLAGEGESHAEGRRRLADARRRIAQLTRRERQVLDWLTQGRSNKEIARELEISPRTVEVHRANMMGKLGATHPADAVRLRLEAEPRPPGLISGRSCAR